MNPEDQHEDPPPALIASIDQSLALAPQLARAMRGIFGAFQQEGFTDTQALYLTAVQCNERPLAPPS